MSLNVEYTLALHRAAQLSEQYHQHASGHLSESQHQAAAARALPPPPGTHDRRVFAELRDLLRLRRWHARRPRPTLPGQRVGS